jgi:hypothetical protein
MRASTSQTFVPLRTDSKLQVAFSPDSLEAFHKTNIMRSNALRNAARTLSGGLKEASIPQSSRAPYICASCRTTSSPRASRQPFAPTIALRAFSAISPQKQDPSTQPTAQEIALPQRPLPKHLPLRPTTQSPFHTRSQTITQRIHPAARPRTSRSRRRRQAATSRGSQRAHQRSLQNAARSTAARTILARAAWDRCRG